LAIKGKRRTRGRSGRTVAAAPRPYLVRPKTPLFRRTGTKVVLVLLAEALIFGLLVLGDAQTDADAARQDVSEFASLVDAQLYQGGAAQQSFGGPLILPELGQTISQLRAGEAKEADVVENAGSWSEVATGAADGLADVRTDRAGLKAARRLMEQGLRLYAGLADEVRVAVQLEGKPQKELIDTIGRQLEAAATVFDAGYGMLQTERRKVGLPPPSQVPSGIPGGIPGLPGGVPGG
jgi:hypothetical protein